MKLPKKSLGQNFLIDKNIIKKIIKLTNLQGKHIFQHSKPADQADYIINVVDISDKNYKDKIQNTQKILQDMSLDQKKINNLITVFNKIDLINRKPDLINDKNYLSAINGQGVDLLKMHMKNVLN